MRIALRFVLPVLSCCVLAAALPAQVMAALKKQHAGRRFAEAAEAFSNLVYEQPESLGPAAERFKLAVQRAQGVTRRSAVGPGYGPTNLCWASY